MNLPLTRSREALLITLLAFVTALAWYLRPEALQVEPAPPASTSGQPAEQPAAPAPVFRLAGEVAVPSIGIKVPLVYVEQVDEQVFQQALEHGVVRYPGTADPGSVGNIFIFGHSSDYRYRAGSYKRVFAPLPKVVKGDEVIVTDSAGVKFTYIVTSSAVVAANDTQYLSQSTGGKKQLTLQTSYPVGTALKRYLVFAELKP